MEVSITLKGDVLKIYIDNTLHLLIKEPIIGFQSWNRENRWWEIEYYLPSKTILTQYDNVDKWKTIVNALDNVFK